MYVCILLALALEKLRRGFGRVERACRHIGLVYVHIYRKRIEAEDQGSRLKGLGCKLRSLGALSLAFNVGT